MKNLLGIKSLITDGCWAELLIVTGYRIGQLMGAWNWGADSNNFGSDETDALNIASTVYYMSLL